MMRISYSVVMFSVLFGLLFSLSYKRNLSESDDRPKTCTAHIVSFYYNTKLDLFLDFVGVRSKKTGSIYLNGTYIENKEIKGYIKREIKYGWEEHMDNFYFTGISINKTSEKISLPDDIVNNFLSDFYITPGNQVYYKIKNINNVGWIFYVGKRPVFFCALN